MVHNDEKDAGYKGINRMFPLVPHRKEVLEQWKKCLELTNGGFPIEYSESNLRELLSLLDMLKEESISSELIIIDNTVIDLNTRFSGYDITNDTMFYSFLGEECGITKKCSSLGLLNVNGLFDNKSDADNLAEFANQQHFENDGKFKSVKIETLII